MISSVLEAFDLNPVQCKVLLLSSGLINKTWKVSTDDRAFILQRINDNVFRRPDELADNIRMIGLYLEEFHPEYLFVSPLQSKTGRDILYVPNEGYFRLFPFVKDSYTFSIVTTPEQAFEAAAQFGKFTRLLSPFDSGKLHITIPDFHNLTLRHEHFRSAVTHGNADRIKESHALIKDVQDHAFILAEFKKITNGNFAKKRVTHHDTKISNVLFNRHDKGLCVIDLDTVMPGYFISDLGDMFRTYLSPANEEEKDFGKIEVREDFFQAIVEGYLGFMRDQLTKEERQLIFYSGLFLTYMQAIRFLTDYLNKDSYYGAAYEKHNFVRAGNQLCLLKKIEEKRQLLSQALTL